MEGSNKSVARKQYYVYILRSLSGVFYIGITYDLVRRIYEHKQGFVDGFTKKYKVNILIYYEVYGDPWAAIAREKQLKNWNRKKKIALITKANPKFEELVIT